MAENHGRFVGDPYETLEVTKDTPKKDVKAAYKKLAKKLHPDRNNGQTHDEFVKLNRAYELLSNDRSRHIWDTYVNDERYKPFAQGAQGRPTPMRAPGGGDAPAGQVAMCCDLCGNIAKAECSICGIMFCDGCCVTPHWRGEHAVHFPMYSDGKWRKKLEKIRAAALNRQRKHVQGLLFRSDQERALQTVVHQALTERAADWRCAGKRARDFADAELSLHYAWGQSKATVSLVLWMPCDPNDHRPVRIPTGDDVPEGTGIRLTSTDPETVGGPNQPPEPRYPNRATGKGSGHSLNIKDAMGNVILDRQLMYAVAGDRAFDVFQSSDLPQMILTFRKANVGELWKSAFMGDSVGLRSADPPFHTVEEANNEILIEVRVPADTAGRDVQCSCTRDWIEVHVDGWGCWRRHILAFPYAVHEAKGMDRLATRAFDPAMFTWIMDQDKDGNRVVQLSLEKLLISPPWTDEEEMEYKQDPYWLLDSVHARLFAEDGAKHLEFEKISLVAQEQVRLMEESIEQTMLNSEPEQKPVDWHCREEVPKTLSQRSIEVEEELTVDEEKELASITAMDGATYEQEETKQKWWDTQLLLDGSREQEWWDKPEKEEESVTDQIEALKLHDMPVYQQVDALESRIRLAVAAEDYELAAECKDKIAELKQAMSEAVKGGQKAADEPPVGETPLERRKRLLRVQKEPLTNGAASEGVSEGTPAAEIDWCNDPEFADELDIE